MFSDFSFCYISDVILHGAYPFYVKIASLTLVFTLFHDDGC